MNIKSPFLPVVLACAALSSAAQDAPANHVDMTEAILDFLSRTELCLQSCADEASTKAAIPQLRQLKQECDTLVAQQKALPEPTVQDYMAVQHHMAAFNTIWQSIRTHVARMQESGLMSAEVAEILHIAPAN